MDLKGFMVLKGLTEQEAKVLRKRFGIVVPRDKEKILREGMNLDVSEQCSMCGEEKNDVQKFFNGKHTTIICETCLKSISEDDE